ncbi:hypothetical protein REH81_33925, partial [Vibrio rotiferianus]
SGIVSQPIKVIRGHTGQRGHQEPQKNMTEFHINDTTIYRINIMPRILPLNKNEINYHLHTFVIFLSVFIMPNVYIMDECTVR